MQTTLTQTKQTLSRSERTNLETLESTIEQGLKTFMEVGNALLAIREQRLYRASHKSFEAYCRDRWHFTSVHANRLIAGAETAGRLEIATASESIIRPLISLEPRQQKAVWERAIKKASGSPEKVTARIVMQEVRRMKPVTKNTHKQKPMINRRDLVEFLQEWYDESGSKMKTNELFLSIIGHIRRF